MQRFGAYFKSFPSWWTEFWLEVSRGYLKKDLEIGPEGKRVFPVLISFQNDSPAIGNGASAWEDFFVLLDFVPVIYKFTLHAVSKQQPRIHIFLVCL